MRFHVTPPWELRSHIPALIQMWHFSKSFQDDDFPAFPFGGIWTNRFLEGNLLKDDFEISFYVNSHWILYLISLWFLSCFQSLAFVPCCRLDSLQDNIYYHVSWLKCIKAGPQKKPDIWGWYQQNHEHGFHMSRSYDSMWLCKERYDIDIDYMGLWNEMPWGLSLSSTYWLLVPGASRRCDWGSAWYVFELAAAIKDTKNRCPAVSKTIQRTKHCLSGC